MNKTLQMIFTIGLAATLSACGGSDTRIDSDGAAGGEGGESGTRFATLSAEYSNILNPSQPVENLRYRCEARLLTGEAELVTTGTTTAAGEFTCDAGMSHVVFYLGQYPTEGALSHYDIGDTRLKPLENIKPNVMTFTNLFASERSTDDIQVINAGRVLYPFETEEGLVIPEAAHATVNVTIGNIAAEFEFSDTDEEAFEDYFDAFDADLSLNEYIASLDVVRAIEAKKRAGIYYLPLVVNQLLDESTETVQFAGGTFYIATRTNQWIGSGFGDLSTINQQTSDTDRYFLASPSDNAKLSDDGSLQNFVLAASSDDNNFSIDVAGRFFESRVYQSADDYADDFGESSSFDEDTDAGRWNTNNGIEDAETRMNKTSFAQFDLTAAKDLYPVVFNIDVRDGEEIPQTIVSELILIAEADGNIYHDADSSCTVNEGDAIVGLQLSDTVDGETAFIRFELLMPRIAISSIQGLSTISGSSNEDRLVLNTSDLSIKQQPLSGDESDEGIWIDYKNESARGTLVSSDSRPPCDLVSTL